MQRPNQLSESEIDRYGRQLLVQGWGSDAQLYLQRAVILIHEQYQEAAFYLAAAGAGKILLLGEKDSTQALGRLLAQRNSQLETLNIDTDYAQKIETDAAILPALDPQRSLVSASLCRIFISSAGEIELDRRKGSALTLSFPPADFLPAQTLPAVMAAGLLLRELMFSDLASASFAASAV